MFLSILLLLQTLFFESALMSPVEEESKGLREKITGKIHSILPAVKSKTSSLFFSI
jgi:hypothetical protein